MGRDSRKWEYSWDRPGSPSCVFPSGVGYAFLGNSDTRSLHLRRRSTPTLFGDDYTKLTLHANDVVGGVNFKIEPFSSKKGETGAAGHNENKDCTSHVSELCLITGDHVRKGELLRLSRERPRRLPLIIARSEPLVYSARFLQITLQLPTENVYGWGEQYHPELRRSFDWRKLSVFNRDIGPAPGVNNLYGAHPFLLALDKRHQAFGIFFRNLYPLDLQLQPGGVLTFRSIGGEMDFFVLKGPTPNEVVQQYLRIIGKPMMPPYWYLGFQLSRFGYKNLDDLKKVWKRNRAAKIPQDVQITDIDYMDGRKDFTFDHKAYQNLSAFIEHQIHASNRKWIPIIDPAIASTAKHYEPLDMGIKMGIFIKDSRTGKPIETRVWPGKTYFPDFTHPDSFEYWKMQLVQFHKLLPFDGIWLDMNDPSNFVQGSLTGCANNSLNYPPYSPVGYAPIFDKTLCLDAVHHGGSHAEWHNRYGLLQANATFQALRPLEPRPAIVSRSTSPGSGAFTAHWSGDVRSTWAALNQSIVSLVEFGMFGVSMIGADICGFAGNSNEELCLRWSQVGAFYSFCRNHNDDESSVEQDPAAWPAPTTAAIRRALNLRYTFLPLLYTLLAEANMDGSVAIQPLFFQFSADPTTWNLRSQFLWGSHFMIVPILQPNAVQRSAYFPKGYWYRVDRTENMMARVSGPGHKSVSIARDTIGLYVRGGAVVFGQEPAETTAESRRNPFILFVAPNSHGNAKGQLYYEDGDFFSTTPDVDGMWWRATLQQNGTHLIHLEMSVQRKHTRWYSRGIIVGQIHFGGIRRCPLAIQINGDLVDRQLWMYNDDRHYLHLHANLSMNIDDNFRTETLKATISAY